ncbi:MAG TPA: hypothetical protein VGH28_24675 [Polyangiaceae bacterium]
MAQGEVSLDNVKIGVLDGQDLEVDPGAHPLRIVLPDGRKFDRTIVGAPGERGRPITFDAGAPSTSSAAVSPPAHAPQRAWTTTRWIGLTALIVGGVGLVVGGVFFAIDTSNVATAGTSNPNECQFRPNPTQCNDALSAAANLDVPVMLGAGIAGAALLATGIVLYIVGGTKTASASALHVTPAIGPHFAGLTLGANF